MLLHYDEVDSPIGRILFASDGERVCALDYEGYESRMARLIARHFGAVDFQRASDPLGLKRAAGELLCRRPPRLRYAPGTDPRQRVSGGRVESPANHTGRGDAELRETRGADPPPAGGPRGGPRQFAQSGSDYRAVSPGHGIFRCAHRICRRPGSEAVAAATRRRAFPRPSGQTDRRVISARRLPALPPPAIMVG